MALFAMSDLHLSLSADKPMDVFGSAWHNYMERIYKNWHLAVSDDDLVIVGGDISWAMYLEDAKKDFEFLNSLPGRKLLSRGNHDYWWSSLSKLKSFTQSNGFDTISFLQNDAFVYQSYVICGTRGWLLPSSDSFSSDDRKVYDRELIRLDLSLQAGYRLAPHLEPLVVLHYPPVQSDGTPDSAIAQILTQYGVKRCIYGHLHGPSASLCPIADADGIQYRLVSADHLSFKPCNLDL